MLFKNEKEDGEVSIVLNSSSAKTAKLTKRINYSNSWVFKKDRFDNMFAE